MNESKLAVARRCETLAARRGVARLTFVLEQLGFQNCNLPLGDRLEQIDLLAGLGQLLLRLHAQRFEFGLRQRELLLGVGQCRDQLGLVLLERFCQVLRMARVSERVALSDQCAHTLTSS